MLLSAKTVVSRFQKELARMLFFAQTIAVLHGGETIAELSKNKLDFAAKESDECWQEEKKRM